MAAITTPSINLLLNQLRQQLTDVELIEGDSFAWSPTKRQITYDPNASQGTWKLLHEIGHAVLGHTSYRRDIELIGYEVAAWSKAEELAADLSMKIPESAIEDDIDTYRDWLHARSLCVSCSQTGIQTSVNTYRCLHCPATWRVNDGRQCGLRRMKI